MGTRADFYVGRGPGAEWLGSTAFDGYPEGIPEELRAATTEKDYRERVGAYLEQDDSATLPEQGWPWPWETSGTTDYAYAFDALGVWASHFGHNWFPADQPEPEDDGGEGAEFPDMTHVQNVTMGSRSGLLVFTEPEQ